MIQNFSDIYHDYDLFFIDIWGVVHDGKTPYPGTVDTINQLLTEKEVFFVSNAPRPNYVVAEKLKEYGIKIENDNIVTSGDVVREYLNKLATEDKIIYHLGEARNNDVLKNHPIKTTMDLSKADFLLLTSYLDDGENLEQFQEIFQQALDFGIKALCANPDITVIHGNSHRYCAGYFAEQFTKMGGEVEYSGKPYKNIYDYAISKLGKAITLDRTLMIGDTIDKDILGASNAGIHSALVLTGNMKVLLSQYNVQDTNSLIPTLQGIFESMGIKPNFVIKGLF